MNELKFKLKGLHCQSCVKISEMNIGDIPGVKKVKIDLSSGEGELEAEHEITLDEISQALKDTDYSVAKE